MFMPQINMEKLIETKQSMTIREKMFGSIHIYLFDRRPNRCKRSKANSVSSTGHWSSAVGGGSGPNPDELHSPVEHWGRAAHYHPLPQRAGVDGRSLSAAAVPDAGLPELVGGEDPRGGPPGASRPHGRLLGTCAHFTFPECWQKDNVRSNLWKITSNTEYCHFPSAYDRILWNLFSPTFSELTIRKKQNNYGNYVLKL